MTDVAERLLTESEVTHLTSLSYNTRLRMRKADRFPKPRIISKSSNGAANTQRYLESEIRQWLSEQTEVAA